MNFLSKLQRACTLLDLSSGILQKHRFEWENYFAISFKGMVNISKISRLHWSNDSGIIIFIHLNKVLNHRYLSIFIVVSYFTRFFPEIENPQSEDFVYNLMNFLTDLVPIQSVSKNIEFVVLESFIISNILFWGRIYFKSKSIYLCHTSHLKKHLKLISKQDITKI